MPIFIQFPDQLKGGPGSGNWGHAGRPGLRGGSAPGGGLRVIGASQDTPVGKRRALAAALRQEREQRRKLTEADEPGGPFNGKIAYRQGVGPANTPERALATARAVGLTTRNIQDMTRWPDDTLETHVTVTSRTENHASVEAVWLDKDGNMAGHMSTVIYRERVGEDSRGNPVYRRAAYMELMYMEASHQDRGVGDAVLRNHMEAFRRMGVEKVTLQADITIGRYAWAKRGFQYAEPNAAAQATARFKTWCQAKGIRLKEYPTFRTPQDVATFSVPGKKIPARKINCPGIRPGDYDLGKAFMLDANGHGPWDGVLYLK